MPLIRISLRKGKPAHHRGAIADGVYEALRETFNVPEHDRFVAVHEHDQRLARVILHDERLHHRMLVNPQMTGRGAGSALLLIGIEVAFERDLLPRLQRERAMGWLRD